MRLLIYLRFLKTYNLLLIWALSLIVWLRFYHKIKLKKLKWSIWFYLFTLKTRRWYLKNIWLKRWNFLERASNDNCRRVRNILSLFVLESLCCLKESLQEKWYFITKKLVTKDKELVTLYFLWQKINRHTLVVERPS